MRRWRTGARAGSCCGAAGTASLPSPGSPAHRSIPAGPPGWSPPPSPAAAAAGATSAPCCTLTLRSTEVCRLLSGHYWIRLVARHRLRPARPAIVQMKKDQNHLLKQDLADYSRKRGKSKIQAFYGNFLIIYQQFLLVGVCVQYYSSLFFCVPAALGWSVSGGQVMVGSVR